MANPKFFNLTGLWKKKTKDGNQTFLSGSLGRFSVLVMPNKNKTEDKHPDYNLFLAPSRRSQEDDGGGGEGRDPGEDG